MIFKTLCAVVGLSLAGNPAIMGQSCPFASDSVWLRVQPATQLSRAPRNIDNAGAPLGEAAPHSAAWPLHSTFTQYSWAGFAPVRDSIVPDELGPLDLHPDHFARFGLDSPSPEPMLLMDRLRRWRIDLTEGLGITSRNHSCRLALDYSDIFEASRFSDKGGHGISLLFRYSFEKHRQLT